MFTRIKSRSLAIVLQLVLLVAGITPSAPGIGDDRSGHDGNAASSTRGAEVYTKYCALCHGANGEGYAADNANALSNPDFLASVGDEFLWWSIAKGRSGTAMAAHARRYGGPLDDADIDSLVTLIRGWQRQEPLVPDPKPVIGDPVSGRVVYEQHCGACHGEAGQGVTAISLNNPDFLALASDGQIRLAIEHGRRGTPMAAYRDRLTEDSIDDLVALIRSWQRETPQRAEAPELLEFPEVVINPDGPPPQFSLRDGRYVSAQQLDAAMRRGARLIILDARPPSDWYLAHIPGAVPAPAYDPDSILIQLPEDDTWIVSYCACPHKYSDMLTDALRAAGYANTAVLDEGVRWWQLQGYPIKYGP